jgi:acetyltransferase-like isoleucine patch superfamily enzyme
MLKFLLLLRIIIKLGVDKPNFLMRWILQIVFLRSSAYWRISSRSKVTGVRNILIGKNTNPGASIGNYIQAVGKISIGDNTIIAPNVGVISSNHSLNNLTKHNIDTVEIGNDCWIGMGAVVLPGAVLPSQSIIAANSVVNKKLDEINCLWAGSPAKKIKVIQMTPIECSSRYHGFVHEKYFPEFRKLFLNV